MIIADGINLPLVALLGLVTFGPLTLLVTLVESLVFRLHLKTAVGAVFKRVLVANVISTLAGAVILIFQDAIIHATGIRESIPAFVRGYRWVGPLLIAAYFVKSVLVEGLCLTQRGFLRRIERPAGRTLRTVMVANIFSYLIVGPVFYITTRPHFAGLQTTFDASWTAAAGRTVYYIDGGDAFVKRKHLGAEDEQTLIPHPTQAFLVSDDESTFAYVGTNGNLYAYIAAKKHPILVRETDAGCYMTTVSLSPDNRRIAYIEPPPGDGWWHDKNARDTLKTLDLADRVVAEIGTLPANEWGAPIAWSANGECIYALRVDRTYDVQNGCVTSEQSMIYVFNADSPFGLREKRTTAPAQSDLVVNYTRAQGQTVYVGGRPAILLPERFQTADYDVQVRPYLGSRVYVERDDERILMLQNEYGFLNLSWPRIEGAVLLPEAEELLLEWWGQSYLLSLTRRRLGLAACGGHFVLRTPQFRVDFDAGSS